MAEHELSIGLSSSWLTPKPIFSGLGLTFDLDPAHPGRVNPYCVVPTRRIYTVDHDGLRQPWCGTLWLNPPFGGRRGQVPWLTVVALALRDAATLCALIDGANP
jgi:hypothetical protein